MPYIYESLLPEVDRLINQARALEDDAEKKLAQVLPAGSLVRFCVGRMSVPAPAEVVQTAIVQGWPTVCVRNHWTGCERYVPLSTITKIQGD